MLFKKKFVLYPVLMSSTLLLTGCVLTDDATEEHPHEAAACSDSAKNITTSDDRTLCVNLTAYKADAPFSAGFKARGKTTHTVFVSDSEGNPVNVTSDDVLTGISQYPMMYMENGHQHSAPYTAADTTAAEYGAYNLDVYYPMPSKMMDGTVMGRWEYRVMVTDNMGTADDHTDDKTHTVTFEPDVEMNMASNEFRAVSTNDSDTYKTSMDLVANRQYSTWLESVGKVVAGEADVKIYLTTQDMEHEAEMAMTKPSSRATEHVHTDGMTMGDTDSQTYPAVHAPMVMGETTMKVTLHDADSMAVDVDTVTVEVSTDAGTTWTMLMAGMTHDELGYYSAAVPMAAGAVEMQVKVTVNGNEMYKNGVVDDGAPSLKFAAAE